MTPTPWAQAVEAAEQADYHSVCGCTDQMHKPECYAAMLRAALPHLLRAVVEELAEGQRADTVALPMQYLDGHTVAEVYRTALLAALTDAAGRVGG